MNAQKISFSMFFILLVSTIYGIINNMEYLVLFGHIFLLQTIAVWYFFKIGKVINPKSTLMIIGLIIGSASDSSILFNLSIYGEFIQIVLAVIVNLVLIALIRSEGVIMYSEKLKDIPLIASPVILIFLFFGYIILPNVPNLIFGVSIIYAMVELFLTIHCLFRMSNRKSYFLTISGVILMLLKDGIYSFHFFVYGGKNSMVYAIQYPLNVLAYFLIVYGLTENKNPVLQLEKYSLNKRLMKFLIQLYRNDFSKLSNQKIS